MFPECDPGAGNDPGQEPWPSAAMHHADHGHNEETGKTQTPEKWGIVIHILFFKKN